MTRHNAATSKSEHERVEESGNARRSADVLLQMIRSANRPVSALYLHKRTHWPYNTVTARLADLRRKQLIIDSDEDPILCPRIDEAHYCCDGTRRLSERKTYGLRPASPQRSLFGKVS